MDKQKKMLAADQILLKKQNKLLETHFLKGIFIRGVTTMELICENK